MKLISTMLVNTFLSVMLLSQASVVYHMYDISDLVVEGTILYKYCDQWEYGTLDCSYRVLVDSIYKGTPELSLDPITNNDCIIFKRKCFYFLTDYLNFLNREEELVEDRCLEKNDRLILFLIKDGVYHDSLKDSQVASYSLVDRYLGATKKDSYLSRHLRQFESRQK